MNWKHTPSVKFPRKRVSFGDANIECLLKAFWLEVPRHEALLKSGADSSSAVQKTAATLQSGRKVFFWIGSIPSRFEAGLPDVPCFKKNLFNSLQTILPPEAQLVLDDPGVREELSRIPFEVFFSLAQQYKTIRLDDLLDIFKLGEPGKVHEFFSVLLGRFPNADILTTNFDCLFERAGIGPVAFRNEHFEPDFLARIWKIHGTAEDPQSIITTIEDTAKSLAPSKTDFLARQIQASQVVFLGYGANDLDIFPVLLSASWETPPVFVLRPIDRNRETWFQYRADDRQKRPFRLLDQQSGFAYVEEGYQGFLRDLAKVLGLDYEPSPSVDVLPAIESRFHTWIEHQQLEQVLAFVADLLVHIGNSHAATVIAECARQPDNPSVLASLARSQFAAGNYKTASRLFRRLYRTSKKTDDSLAIMALSNRGECYGLRYSPIRAAWYLRRGIRGARCLPQCAGTVRLLAWTELRWAQGRRQIAKRIHKLSGIPTLGRLFSYLYKRLDHQADCVLEQAVEQLKRIGDEYGSQSALRLLAKITGTTDPKALYDRNKDVADRLLTIGREIETIDVYREQVVCLLAMPQNASVTLGNEPFAAHDAARLLSLYCFTHSLAKGAWVGVAKTCRNLVALSTTVSDRALWSRWTINAIHKSELGLFGFLLARLVNLSVLVHRLKRLLARKNN